MSFRNSLRTFERAWLRPLGRTLRLPRLGRRSGRLAALEARVEELESLTRELTGLVYMQLDDEARQVTRPTDPPDTREAA